MNGLVRALGVGLVLGLATTGACRQAPEAPPAAPPAAKAKGPVAFNASMYRLGPITAATRPTVGAVAAVLGDGYTAAEPVGGSPGATVHVRKGEELVLEIFASADGTRIERVLTASPAVNFPWGAKVGGRVGSHKHWDRMACALGEGLFAGKALCQAYEAGRIAYVVEGWPGKPEELPAKELMADLTITAMVWTPQKGDADKVK